MSAGPELVPFDLTRMFLGDLPPLFLLEIVVRTTLIFLWLIVLLRVTGKRSLAQLSTLELAIVIGLGSAAGDPMFYPEVPLLHAMLVLTLVVLLQRLTAHLVIRSETVETLLEGTPVELVRDGVIRLSALQATRLSHEDLFERLRGMGVRQLGEVQRAYFEQDGNITAFRHDAEPPAGLAIVPPWDLEAPAALSPDLPQHERAACLTCGQTVQAAGLLGPCTCGGHDWTRATVDPLASGPGTEVSGGKKAGAGPAAGPVAKP
ncbi:DUF421 domain-containing protein [Deinococcus hohokamensis]|uniref:DUF421 domain-containing protein n=1 Tax=Deinococcus hohokamensis TaxID=309883 RepID=A0ABV9IBJ9_9DEIO